MPPTLILAAALLLSTAAFAGNPGKADVTLNNSTLPAENDVVVSATIDILTQLDCTGLPIGVLLATATGGTPPYLYVWSNGFVGPLNVGLAAGVYTCTVTDLLGATATASITLDPPPPVFLSVVAQVNIDCINVTGSAEVAATGGTAPYAYVWSNGTTGSTATGLTAGVHLVTVTDGAGCTAIQAVVILENLIPPIVNAGIDLEINCLNPTVTLEGSGSVGGTFAALWTTLDGNILSGEVTLNSCVVDAAGTYTLTITDLLNGCFVSDEMVVDSNFILPPVVANVVAEINCLNATVTLDGSGT